MKRHFGVVIFIFLFISVVSIIAILVARGVNFTGNEVKENGILNLVSEPEGAKILINGEEKGVTPEKIELLAGEYEVVLAKDGYKDWKKEVEVEPAIVTDISTTLFPLELNLEQTTFTSIDKAFFSDDGSIAIFTVSTKTNKGIWLTKLEKSIFELSSSQPEKIADLSIIPDVNIENKNYQIKIDSENSKAIISAPQEEYTLFMLIDLKDSSTEPFNINDNLGFNPTNVSFSAIPNNLLVSDNEIIALYDLVKNSTSLISRLYEGYEPLMTQAKDDYLILEYSYNKKKRTLFKLTSTLEKEEIALADSINLQDVNYISGSKENDEYIVISTEESSSIVNIKDPQNTDPIEFSESSIEGKSWSLDGESFLFKEGDSLKALSIYESPSGETKIKSYTLIEIYSSKKYKVKWSNNSQQLVMNDLESKKIYVVDKDGSNKRLLYEGELTYSDSFLLSQNETFLVLLIKDDQEYSNLYSFKLVI